MLILLIALIVLGLILFSSWFIANKVYNGLRKSNIVAAYVWSLIVFILIAAILTTGILFLVYYNVRIER